MHSNRTTQTNRLKEGNADGDAVAGPIRADGLCHAASYVLCITSELPVTREELLRLFSSHIPARPTNWDSKGGDIAGFGAYST